MVALLRPYDVVHTAPGTFVTEFFFTRESFSFMSQIDVRLAIDTGAYDEPVGDPFFVVALLPAGPLLLSPVPVWYSP